MTNESNDFPIQVFSQWTPNPNAYKFIISEFVIGNGKATFLDSQSAVNVPLVESLFSLKSVTQVHLHENVLTITQDGSEDWAHLSEQIEKIIVEKMPSHDCNFVRVQTKNRSNLSPEIQKIEEILDRTIRPGLQGDGGDVEVVSLEGNALNIRYEGACGTCPSSRAGTLAAITSFIHEEYNSEIVVNAL